MSRLLSYLQINGILLCNANPYLPALEDIRCSWNDMTELIDSHQLFYCKAFRKRTTYLSAEVYYLLKVVSTPKKMSENAKTIYRMLDGKPSGDTKFLKEAAGLPAKDFQAGFDFLLQNLYITALENGKQLHETWSSFYYGTAGQWEQYAPDVYDASDARERLREILSRTMQEKDIKWLIKQEEPWMDKKRKKDACTAVKK